MWSMTITRQQHQTLLSKHQQQQQHKTSSIDIDYTSYGHDDDMVPHNTDVTMSTTTVTTTVTPMRYKLLVISLIVFASSLFLFDSKVVNVTHERSSYSSFSITEEAPRQQHEQQSTTLVTPYPTAAPISFAPTTSSPTISPTTLPPYVRAKNLTKTITIIVQVSGELANNLHHIAHGLGLKYWAFDEYGISSNVIVHHGQNKKWIKAKQDIDQCFPILSSTIEWKSSFNNQPFESMVELQNRWLGEQHHYLTGLINSQNNVTETELGLQFLSKIIKDPERPFLDSQTYQLPYL
jgi:hypothetical protein